jgi:hypothetical protein
VLLAPVTVTPTKPLTPSHLKGLLWTDVTYRSTALLADVTYRYSLSTYHLTEQTLGFWEFLDRTVGDADYSDYTDGQIGDLYMRHRAEDARVPYAALRPYAEAVEAVGWVHPASARIQQLWQAQYAALGLHDPGLSTVDPPLLGLEPLLAMLGDRDRCLDLRRYGGPAYLDLTRYGLPLRQIVTAEGQPNYLACALRELVGLAARYDEVVLLCDRDLGSDYLLLQRILAEFGPQVCRVLIDRVPVDGVVRTSRHGGWHGSTAAELLGAALAEWPAPAVRLGMRLYFVAVLGHGQQQSFRHDLLRHYLGKADRMLSAGAGAGAEVGGGAGRAADGEAGPGLTPFLRRHTGGNLHVDAYRLTSSLLARRRPTPLADAARLIYT